MTPSEPDAYRWSSHARSAGGAHEPRITPHPAYLQLGSDAESRQAAFLELFKDELAAEHAAGLRLHTQQQKAWGSDRFRQQVEALTQRAAGVRPRGRPRSADK